MSEQAKKNPDELGALWLKSGAKGEYMTGTIEGIGPVVCFRNSSDNPKAPAWRVLKSKPQATNARPHERAAWSDGAIPAQSSDIGW